MVIKAAITTLKQPSHRESWAIVTISCVKFYLDIHVGF